MWTTLEVDKSWRTQPRHPAGSSVGGQWVGMGGGGFVPLAGVVGLTLEQRMADANANANANAVVTSTNTSVDVLPFKSKLDEAEFYASDKLESQTKQRMSRQEFTTTLDTSLGGKFSGGKFDKLLDAHLADLPDGKISIIVKNPTKSSRVSFELRVHDRNTNERLVTIQRSIRKETKDQGLVVEHQLFNLARSQQQHGIGKKVLRNAMSSYEELGVSKVEVSADITVGGYVWAKFGFVPKETSGLISELHRARVPSELIDGLYTNPKAVWNIADNQTYGKSLLGLKWKGQLSLDDKEAMARFKEYVSK